jgi:hypothetical protein
MDKLSSVLPKMLRKRGIEGHAMSSLAVHRAMQWMNERLPALQNFIEVKSVQDGVLYIECAHSVAMQECQCATADLLGFLRLECPFSAIKDIRIVRN